MSTATGYLSTLWLPSSLLFSRQVLIGYFSCFIIIQAACVKLWVHKYRSTLHFLSLLGSKRSRPRMRKADTHTKVTTPNMTDCPKTIKGDYPNKNVQFAQSPASYRRNQAVCLKRCWLHVAEPIPANTPLTGDLHEAAACVGYHHLIIGILVKLCIISRLQYWPIGSIPGLIFPRRSRLIQIVFAWPWALKLSPL